MALKSGKKVILLEFDTGDIFECYRQEGFLVTAGTPEQVIRMIKEYRNIE